MPRKKWKFYSCGRRGKQILGDNRESTERRFSTHWVRSNKRTSSGKFLLETGETRIKAVTRKIWIWTFESHWYRTECWSFVARWTLWGWCEQMGTHWGLGSAPGERREGAMKEMEKESLLLVSAFVKWTFSRNLVCTLPITLLCKYGSTLAQSLPCG